MGRNGFMGSFQGLDAFGKVSLTFIARPVLCGTRQTRDAQCIAMPLRQSYLAELN